MVWRISKNPENSSRKCLIRRENPWKRSCDRWRILKEEARDMSETKEEVKKEVRDPFQLSKNDPCSFFLFRSFFDFIVFTFLSWRRPQRFRMPLPDTTSGCLFSKNPSSLWEIWPKKKVPLPDATSGGLSSKDPSGVANSPNFDPEKILHDQRSTRTSKNPQGSSRISINLAPVAKDPSSGQDPTKNPSGSLDHLK